MSRQSTANVIAVIPARMASSRFPGKPLARIAGKPMLRWVWERVCETDWVDEVLISTPDQAIFDEASSWGAHVVPSSESCPSGTDRVAEVAATSYAEVYLNVQGDEPLVRPADIRACLRPMVSETRPDAASVCCPCTAAEASSPDVVKVVTDAWGYALYFSRSLIPYPRFPHHKALRHLGIYAFTRATVLEYPKMRQRQLELSEGLEQLRLLEHGYTIAMTKVRRPAGPSVDTPAQLAAAERILLRSAAG